MTTPTKMRCERAKKNFVHQATKLKLKKGKKKTINPEVEWPEVESKGVDLDFDEGGDGVAKFHAYECQLFDAPPMFQLSDFTRHILEQYLQQCSVSVSLFSSGTSSRHASHRSSAPPTSLIFRGTSAASAGGPLCSGWSGRCTGCRARSSTTLRMRTC